MTHPLRVAENCTTHPLHKAQNLMTHPLSAPAHPPLYFLTSPLKVSFNCAITSFPGCSLTQQGTRLNCIHANEVSKANHQA